MKNSINKLMVFGLLVGFAVNAQEEDSLEFDKATEFISSDSRDRNRKEIDHLHALCSEKVVNQRRKDKSIDRLPLETRCVELGVFMRIMNDACLRGVEAAYYEEWNNRNRVTDDSFMSNYERALNTCRNSIPAFESMFDGMRNTPKLAPSRGINDATQKEKLAKVMGLAK